MFYGGIPNLGSSAIEPEHDEEIEVLDIRNCILQILRNVERKQFKDRQDEKQDRINAGLDKQRESMRQ